MTGDLSRGEMRFHHVALTVADVDRSAEWYGRVLGFEVAFREEGDARRAIVMRFAGGTYSVGFVQHDRDAPVFDPAITGLDHLAFAVPSREDLERWARRLDGEGVAHSGVIDIPVGGIVNFKDPDGIALALFWDR